MEALSVIRNQRDEARQQVSSTVAHSLRYLDVYETYRSMGYDPREAQYHAQVYLGQIKPRTGETKRVRPETANA